MKIVLNCQILHKNLLGDISWLTDRREVLLFSWNSWSTSKTNELIIQQSVSRRKIGKVNIINISFFHLRATRTWISTLFCPLHLSAVSLVIRYFLLFLLCCWWGKHCCIYKSSYNISSISHLYSPPSSILLHHTPLDLMETFCGFSFLKEISKFVFEVPM
jgi:hypothetical protein